MFLFFVVPVLLIHSFSGYPHDKIASIIILLSVMLFLYLSVRVGFQKWCDSIVLREACKGESATESSQFSKGAVVAEFYFLKYPLMKNRKGFLGLFSQKRLRSISSASSFW